VAFEGFELSLVETAGAVIRTRRGGRVGVACRL
jgi:hypothetical protein